MARFHCPMPLHTGDVLSLPPSVARHVQVLRLQPGDDITLFNGQGGEFQASITRMGRSDVEVQIGAHSATEREAACAVHLLAGITANERMDWLVEKATELGAASLTPVIAERSVLKLKGERAEKKLAHWQGVAVAASEQLAQEFAAARVSPGLGGQGINMLVLGLDQGAIRTAGAALADLIGAMVNVHWDTIRRCRRDI